MTCPANPETTTSAEMKGNLWLTLSLVFLWLVVGCGVMPVLWRAGDYGRAVLFCALAGAYLWMVESHASHRWHQKYEYRYYFPLMLGLHGVLWCCFGESRVQWLLILPTLAQAILFLSGRYRAVVAALLAGIALAPIATGAQAYPLQWLINVVSSLCFTAGASWMIRREFDSRRQLHVAHEKLREHAEKIEALAVVEERNRFAREIHDGVAHHLTAANVLTEAGVALLPPEVPEAARDSLQKAQGQIRAALADLRHAIRAGLQEDASEPLAQRIDKLVTRGGFPAVFEQHGVARRCRAEVEHALFRVAQEALTNARKHAPGETVRLCLDWSVPGRVALLAENLEARGESPSGDGAFGLLSLRHRLEALAGEFHAGSDGAGKFVVRAEVAS